RSFSLSTLMRHASDVDGAAALLVSLIVRHDAGPERGRSISGHVFNTRCQGIYPTRTGAEPPGTQQYVDAATVFRPDSDVGILGIGRFAAVDVHVQRARSNSRERVACRDRCDELPLVVHRPQHARLIRHARDERLCFVDPYDDRLTVFLISDVVAREVGHSGDAFLSDWTRQSITRHDTIWLGVRARKPIVEIENGAARIVGRVQ